MSGVGETNESLGYKPASHDNVSLSMVIGVVFPVTGSASLSRLSLPVFRSVKARFAGLTNSRLYI